MFIFILALMPLMPGPQEAAANAGAQEHATTPEHQAPTAEGLRSKVHKLRMDLLLGGEQVQRAESEAIGFYDERLELIDRRLDRLDVDLSEKRASYQLALAQTVEAPSGGAIREASRLRAEIARLESEAAGLRRKRAQLAAVIDGIADRSNEREALAANLAANSGMPIEAGLPMSTIGFGPGEVNLPPPSPFDDPQLVRELIALDPRRGRTALFDADPQGYWEFFTLQPPPVALREVLKFPLPDLPGSR